MAALLATARLVHPAPALAVVTLSAALGAIVSSQAGLPVPSWRLVAVTLAVAGSQILTGALNEWADRERDARVQASKPIPSGMVRPTTALALAGAGALLQVAASLPLGGLPLLLGIGASVSAVAYNLWLSRTPLSVLPYLVSFGLLPLWIASGVGVGLGRVAGASLLVAPFAAAAHLANTLRDFEADAAEGSRNLAQFLGRRSAHRLALWLALGVGLVVALALGLALGLGGRASVPSVTFTVIGLGAVLSGARSAQRLWRGMLVAAVCWTIGWALATG